MSDPRDPVEISFSLQLLNAGVPLAESLAVAQVLHADRFGKVRSSQEQALIWQVWQQLQQTQEVTG
jgi:hypothetical protein